MGILSLYGVACDDSSVSVPLQYLDLEYDGKNNGERVGEWVHVPCTPFESTSELLWLN